MVYTFEVTQCLFVLDCALHNGLFRNCYVAVAKKVSGTFFSEWVTRKPINEAVIEIS